MALRYARYVAPRGPVRMKSFLLSVRQPARSGASMRPVTREGVAGVSPSQSQPLLMTLPNVLTAMPSRSSSLTNGELSRRSRRRDGRRDPPAADADRDGRPVAGRARGRRHWLPSTSNAIPAGSAVEQLLEGGIEQRLEVAADGFLEVARVEERRQRIGQAEPHRRAALAGEPRRRDPLPGRTIPRGQVPPGRDVRRAAPRLGDHVRGDEQSELDADPGKANPFPARLRARRHVVIPGQVAPLHPPPIVDNRERRCARAGLEADPGGAGVERVGDDLGENRFLEGAGVGVAEVFEQVLEVDPGFAHEESYGSCTDNRQNLRCLRRPPLSARPLRRCPRLRGVCRRSPTPTIPSTSRRSGRPVATPIPTRSIPMRSCSTTGGSAGIRPLAPFRLDSRLDERRSCRPSGEIANDTGSASSAAC